MSALLPGLGHFAVGTDPVSNFPPPEEDRSWELRRLCACALAPVAAHACALAPAATHSCALAPGPVGAVMGICQPQDSWLEYPYFTFP